MKRVTSIVAIMALLALAAGLPGSAEARPSQWRGDFHSRGDSHWRGGDHWRSGDRWRGGDYWRSSDHWRHSGHWHHGSHGGRFGWWWVLGPAWYYYAAPIYPYPEIVEIETVPIGPPPVQYWYYCDTYSQYYPYASSCPIGWRAVPAP